MKPLHTINIKEPRSIKCGGNMKRKKSLTGRANRRILLISKGDERNPSGLENRISQKT
jgi:hypothetical protein